VDKRLVRAHSPRYSVDSGLAGEIGSLRPLEEDEEWVLNAVARWAESNRLEFGRLAEELDALLALFRRAARGPGFEKLVVRLGRAIDAALAWSRRFGAWGEVLAAVLAAAERLGDQAAVAWALHEMGVREVALGRVRLGRQQLRKAARIRRALGDDAGLAATRHNLAVARPIITILGPLGAIPLATLPLVILALVLASGGAAAAWFITHHHGHGSSFTSFSTSTTTAAPERPLLVRVIGRGTVTVSPGGHRCSERCRFEFSADSPVRLAAHADAGMPFLRWSGDCGGPAACRLTLDRSRSVVAVFRKKAGKTARLEVDFSGTGDGRVTSSPAGVDCTEKCTARFTLGTDVTLTATKAAGSKFVGWSGGRCSGTGVCEVTMTGDHRVVVRFDRVRRGPTGSTAPTTTTSPSTTTPGSSTRPTTTTPSSSSTPSTTMPPTYVLTLQPGSGGLIFDKKQRLRCASPCTRTFTAGTSLMLGAEASPGYEAASWGGACSKTPRTQRCALPMDGDKIVTAAFVPTFPVALTLTGSSGDVVAHGKRYGDTFTCRTNDPQPCSTRFPVKEIVTFTAEPDPGYMLYTWGGACPQGNSTTCTLTIGGPTKIGAMFGKTPD
jgi:hypothetical protein